MSETATRRKPKRCELVKVTLQPIGEPETIMAADWPSSNGAVPAVVGYMVQVFLNVKQGGKIVSEEATQPQFVALDDWPELPKELAGRMKAKERQLNDRPSP